MRNLPELAEALMPTVGRAGRAIMQIYDGNFTVQRKDDNSPLTLADLESQRIILGTLTDLTP
jgi:3'(2'), 5'-bisphosphate nucleotidase